MRILVVTNLYPPHAFGGYELLCAGAVAAWRAAGHDVHVLTSRWRRDDVPADAPPPAGEPVARRLPLYWDDHRVLDPPLPTCARWEAEARRVVSSAVESARPDVVSVWNAGALPLGMFTYLARHDLPIVLVVGNRWLWWALDGDPWARRFVRAPGRVLARAVTSVSGLSTTVDSLGHRVIACFASDFLRQDAAERSRWTFDAAPLVPHGIDRDRFPSVDPKSGGHVGGRGSEDRTTWHGRLLFVGRVAFEKGIPTAVRALSHLPRVTLDVVGGGDGAHVQVLRDLARGLGVADRVHLRGEVAGSALRDAYLDADVLVFPSRWQEPFGLVPLEAMACGLPVVATASGGSGEFLVDGVTALTFGKDDDVGLAAAVERLRDDPGLRRRLRSNGAEVAGWLDRARTYDELLGWHRHAAHPSVPPPPERPVLPPSLHDAGSAAGGA